MARYLSSLPSAASAGVALALAAAFLGLAGSFHGSERATACSDVQASRAGWAATRTASLRSRSPTGAEAMASDFARCRTLAGLSAPHVRRLLGPPDRIVARPGTASPREWLYRLDLNRGILSHPEYLRLNLGRSHSVTGAALVEGSSTP
jgi:hypothetical protein